MASYLRSHRLKSGMSQSELAEIVGFIAHHQVSLHERFVASPSLLTALSYQVVFGVPVTELFPGLYEPIRIKIEERLANMEKQLGESTAKSQSAQTVARKLEWLCMRKSPQTADPTE